MSSAYNFRMYDKAVGPTEINITKQLQTSPNVLRMFFSSTDKDSSSTSNNPSFNIGTNVFSKFDPKRPIYCTLDFFTMTSASNFASPYNICWMNMPCSHSTWYTNNQYKNIMATVQKDGSNFYVRPLPYVLNQQDLINNGVWSFAFVDHTHNLLGNTYCSNFIFAISFYQDTSFLN